MNKWILLKFMERNGEGYTVLGELWIDNVQIVQLTGSLSPVTSLFDLYRHWKALYLSLRHESSFPIGINSRGETLPPEVLKRDLSEDEDIIIEPGITHGSEIDFHNLCTDLGKELNRWLGESSLAEIDRSFRKYLYDKDEILINIQTDDSRLWRLPWSLWNFLVDFRGAEVILSPLRNVSASFPASERTRLLAIFGNDTGIDLDRDRVLLERLQERGVEYRDLRENWQPNELTVQNIVEALWEPEGWSIFFFAGHSSSGELSSSAGVLHINESTPLPLTRIYQAMKNAINNGLQVAIFNSCDGTALARELLNWNLPRAIVMREEVPDPIAVEFLKHFLNAFLNGDSLPIALRRSREKLEHFEHDFPCATWLPVLCQNATVPLLTWESLGGEFRQTNSPPVEEIISISWFDRLWNQIEQSLKILALFVFGFLAGFLTHSIITPNSPPPLDAYLYPEISLGEEVLFADNKRDNDIEKGVKAFQEAIQASSEGQYRKDRYREAFLSFQKALDRSRNNPEIRIYYNNALAAYFDEKPLKIAVSVPLGNNPEIAKEILRGIALFQEEFNNNLDQSKKINFHFLQVVIANDDNNAEKARDRAKRFVQDPSIIAAIGHNASSASDAAKEIYINGKIVAISPTSFSSQFVGRQYIYRMVPSTEIFASALSEYVRKEFSKSTIQNPTTLICYDPRSGDNFNFADKYRKIIQGQPFQKLVNEDCNLYPTENNQIDEVTRKIQDSIEQQEVNILMVAPYVNDLERGIRVFKGGPDREPKLTLLGSPTFQTYRTIREGGEDVENLTLAAPWYDLKQDDYINNFWNNPVNVWRTPMSYDAAKVILTALTRLHQQQKSLTRESLDRVLREPGFTVEGITGTVRFNADDGIRNLYNHPDRLYQILQIRDGRFDRLQ